MGVTGYQLPPSVLTPRFSPRPITRPIRLPVPELLRPDAITIATHLPTAVAAIEAEQTKVEYVVNGVRALQRLNLSLGRIGSVLLQAHKLSTRQAAAILDCDIAEAGNRLIGWSAPASELADFYTPSRHSVTDFNLGPIRSDDLYLATLTERFVGLYGSLCNRELDLGSHEGHDAILRATYDAQLALEASSNALIQRAEINRSLGPVAEKLKVSPNALRRQAQRMGPNVVSGTRLPRRLAWAKHNARRGHGMGL